MIDPVTVQKIKDTADIVEVVSDYVHLTRRGANYMGLCPFHNERTPSFSVNRSRNFCYCFSCHKGGSPVNFIMEKEGISYHEALLQLAKKYGIEVRERKLTNEEREQQTKREAMLVANEWAKDYFISNLETEEGQNIGLTYIYGRKVTPEALRAFSLGYALDKSSDYTDSAIKKGFSLDILKTTGLTGTSQQGRNYDKFRGRVIFPIINTAGKTVAFGARDIKGTSPAKYINSPESEVYSKSHELYGIYQAKGEMVRNDKCYLVEGYLDVIGMWQDGVKNVVASSGTALTDGQISLIHRFTDNVTLIYDGDAAGIKASLRGIDMLLSHNLNVKAVLLPDGEDPDSLAGKLSPDELKKFLAENEVDIIRFKINVLLDEAKNDPQKRWRAVRSIVESIAHIADKIKREIYIQECSNLLDIKEVTLSSDVSKIRYQIVENEKTRRRQEELKKQFQNSDNPSQDNSTVNQPATETSTNNKSHLKGDDISPIYPLEKELIYNCLKYGFISLWTNENNDESDEDITVIEFISEELGIDGITFTHPEYKIIFDELIKLLPVYKDDILKNEDKIKQLLKEKRKEGYDLIASHNHSMIEIKREETKLEERLSEIALEEREKFARDYILDKFGSHENSILRYHTQKANTEIFQLSSIFTKNNTLLKNKEEKIVPLLVTSLNLLKNGIIDLQLKALMDELKQVGNENSDKGKDLHSRIAEIIQMRSRMAKDIGDRIIDPRSLKSMRK